jgi:hypothetical protein
MRTYVPNFTKQYKKNKSNGFVGLLMYVIRKKILMRYAWEHLVKQFGCDLLFLTPEEN